MVVKGKVEAVGGIVPRGGLLGRDEEGVVGVEEDGDGLDPREVTGQGGVALADEMGINVEVVVSDEAEVTVFLAMEVECDAIAPHKSGVLTHCTWSITTYRTICYSALAL